MGESELVQRLSAANPPPFGLPRRRVKSSVRLRVWRQGQAFAAFDPKRSDDIRLLARKSPLTLTVEPPCCGPENLGRNRTSAPAPLGR